VKVRFTAGFSLSDCRDKIPVAFLLLPVFSCTCAMSQDPGKTDILAMAEMMDELALSDRRHVKPFFLLSFY